MPRVNLDALRGVSAMSVTSSLSLQCQDFILREINVKRVVWILSPNVRLLDLCITVFAKIRRIFGAIRDAKCISIEPKTFRKISCCEPEIFSARHVCMHSARFATFNIRDNRITSEFPVRPIWLNFWAVRKANRKIALSEKETGQESNIFSTCQQILSKRSLPHIRGAAQ